VVQINRVPVEFPDGFPYGAFVLSVAAIYDFEASTKDRKVQALDRTPTCRGGSRSASMVTVRRGTKTSKVKFASAVQPLPPPRCPARRYGRWSSRPDRLRPVDTWKGGRSDGLLLTARPKTSGWARWRNRALIRETLISPDRGGAMDDAKSAAAGSRPR
jgi:hypothetical protein